MQELKERILEEGRVINDEILKVDSFINHQVDSELMSRIGQEFANHFKDKGITKVVTVETGGIVPAVFTALTLKVPLVMFKKGNSKTLSDELYQINVKSFTKGTEYNLVVSKKYINEKDNMLFIDDFLAHGETALGVIEIINMAKSNLAGIGILIEKSFQGGREKIQDKGYEVDSLVRIERFVNGQIELEE